MPLKPTHPSGRALPVLPAAAAPGPARPWRSGAAAGLRVGLVTLGCDKNTVDSERLLAELLAAGARVSDEPAGADVVVVNTCGFIDVAKAESVDAILDAVRLKQAGRVQAVAAIGCLVQRYKGELEAELPEVDLFLGTTEADRLVPELRARGLLADEGTSLMERPLRVLTGATRHSSYLKISEGCDHGCAFCAIPLMRGKHRSTPIERLVREASELEAAGVVELNIVSQDTTWYGRDILRGLPAAVGPLSAGRVFEGMSGLSLEADSGTAGRRDSGSVRPSGPESPRAPGEVEMSAEPADAGPPPSRRLAVSPSVISPDRRNLLPDLLAALLSATAIPWLRLFYLYPSGIDRRLVELIAAEPRIARYVDMPIQHGSDRVLQAMRRPERRATIRERVAWLREAIPGVALRSTVIVGFPGETEEDFEALLELLEELRFDHLGAFAYSVEEGTLAATMAGQVPEAVRRERLERVLELQRSIALEHNEARLGRETTILVEHVDAAGAMGRAPWQAPELDGIVRLVHGAQRPGALEPLRAGAFVPARIVEASEDDLVAEILG